jgi:hypothetical protein
MTFSKARSVALGVSSAPDLLGRIDEPARLLVVVGVAGGGCGLRAGMGVSDGV